MELVLVKYQEDFGYGCLDGMFICAREELDTIKGGIVYYGEALGKHSDVFTEDAYENCEVVDTQEGDLEVLVRLFGVGTISGYNPIEHLEEEEEWEELEYDDEPYQWLEEDDE